MTVSGQHSFSGLTRKGQRDCLFFKENREKGNALCIYAERRRETYISSTIGVKRKRMRGLYLQRENFFRRDF